MAPVWRTKIRGWKINQLKAAFAPSQRYRIVRLCPFSFVSSVYRPLVWSNNSDLKICFVSSQLLFSAFASEAHFTCKGSMLRPCWEKARCVIGIVHKFKKVTWNAFSLFYVQNRQQIFVLSGHCVLHSSVTTESSTEVG